MKTRYFVLISLLVLIALILSACSSKAADAVAQRFGPGNGMGPSMMNRHHAQVPAEFAGLTNPIPADEESLARGEEIYAARCTTCHGDYGNGDGPGGASLTPAPAAIAHTSQMLGDAYLFWRITEGGMAFETGMLPFRDILDEQARWDVINYVRALGSGQVQPGQMMGGQPFDPAQEQIQHAEMLAQAVEQGVITQAEADTFDLVHTAMDKYLVSEGISGLDTGPRADALPEILGGMVAAKLVSQPQADTFLDVHNRLIEAGLMQ